MEKEQTSIQLTSPLGEVLKLKSFSGVSISQSSSSKVSSFSVDTSFFDETEMKKFSIGSTVEIFLNYFKKEETGTRIFKGVIAELPKSLNAVEKIYQISGFDKLSITQRILVNESYENQNIQVIFLDLLNRYAVMHGLKIGIVEAIPYDITISFKDTHLFTCLEKLCETIGFTFKINLDDEISIVSNKDRFSTIPIKIDDYSRSTASFSLDSSNLVNSLTIYGGKTLSRDITQYVTADGKNNTFLLNFKPRASSSGSIQIYVNDIQQQVGIKGLTEENVNVLVDYHEKNISFVDLATGEEIVLASGSNIKAIYRYESPIVASLTNDESIAIYGLYQDKMDAPDITDKSALFDKARQHLDKYSKPVITGELSTWKNDHNLGENVQIQIKTDEGFFIDETLQITEKNMTLTPGEIKISYKFEQKKGLNQVLKDILGRLAELESSDGSEEIQKITNISDLLTPSSIAVVLVNTHKGFVIGKGLIGSTKL